MQWMSPKTWAKIDFPYLGTWMCSGFLLYGSFFFLKLEVDCWLVEFAPSQETRVRALLPSKWNAGRRSASSRLVFLIKMGVHFYLYVCMMEDSLFLCHPLTRIIHKYYLLWSLVLLGFHIFVSSNCLMANLMICNLICRLWSCMYVRSILVLTPNIYYWIQLTLG